MLQIADFFKAVSEGNREYVMGILEMAPEFACTKNESGSTAIQMAMYHGQKELAREMASKTDGLDFATAVTLGDVSQVSPQLAIHPAQANQLSADGFLPLCLAAAFGHEEMVRTLLEGGADVNARSRSLGGVAPLHSAAFGRNPTIVKALLDAGADVDARQQGGFTALHAAAQNGDAEIAQLLVAAGADKGLRTDDGKAATDLATSDSMRVILA